MKKAAILGVLMLAGLLGSGASMAHVRFHGGVFIGGPMWWGPPPIYYSPPPVYVQPAPPVYIQQAPPPTYVERQPEYWYYCAQSATYYPYVKSCPRGWMKVVPGDPTQPPSAPGQGG